jgi:hypothetical protein
MSNSSMWIDGCIFLGDEARNGNGGGINVEGIGESGSVNISRCLFDKCKGVNGGGICVRGMFMLLLLLLLLFFC